MGRNFALAAAAASLLVAGCGGGSRGPSVASVSGAGTVSSAPPKSSVPWAHCMTRHGILASADPGGYISLPRGSDRLPQFPAAQKACYRLLPVFDRGGGGPMSTPQAGQLLLEYARCMRAHGFPSYPDPTFANGQWTPRLPTNVDPSSPRFRSADHTCGRIAPALPGAHGG